jgi:Na+/proline symporter
MHSLPNGISGLVITAIFAAAMSSMDSGISSLGSVLTNDFIRPLRRRPRSELYEVRLARRLAVILGALATGVAFYVAQIGDIIDAFATFISRFSAPVLALFLLGVLTRRARFGGWLAGTVCGISVTWALQRFTELNWSYYVPCTFFITLIIGYLASLCMPPAQGPGGGLTIWARGPTARVGR